MDVQLPYARMVATFDGREYGKEYLVVVRGALAKCIQHVDEDGMWKYVCIYLPASDVGWVPVAYLEVCNARGVANT